MYVLFVLEGAFILPKRSQVWVLVAASSALYGLALFGEYLGWLPHVDLPFVDNVLYANLTYVLVRYLWKVTLYAGAALMGMLMMKSIHEREAELRECSFIDELTGLFNRPYFQRVLSTELERARRNECSLALVLADVDGLGEINRTFGVDVGDALLTMISQTLHEVSDVHASDGTRNVDIACRCGGEELALIMPVLGVHQGAPPTVSERAVAVAEEFRRAVESVRASGVSATVSVGVAIAPRDGESSDALIDAADRMLSEAVRGGGNTVRVTWLTEPADGDV
jgi:diguanylate cyclase (GGDEF)-like protein